MASVLSLSLVASYITLLDFEQFFSQLLYIMDCKYKGVGGEGRWGGGVGGEGGWEAGGGPYLPIELFGVAMSRRTTSHRPRQAWRA